MNSYNFTRTPTPKGSKNNKIAAIVTGIVAGVMLIRTAACWNDKPKFAAYLTGALIPLTFCAFFCIRWWHYHRKERSQQAKYDEAMEEVMSEDAEQQDHYSVFFRRFDIPQDELLHLWRKRVFETGIWGVLISAVLTGSWALWFYKNYGFESKDYLTALIMFSFFALPGVIMQGAFLLSYTKSLPSRITLHDSKLSIDQYSFYAREIRMIRISHPDKCDINDPTIFRTLCVCTAEKTFIWKIDSRSRNRIKQKEFLRYEQYEELVDAFIEWGERYGVPVQVVLRN